MSGDNVVKAVKAGALKGAPAQYLNPGQREVTITLIHPFLLDGVEYRTLTAHKLTGRDIFAVNRTVEELKEKGVHVESEAVLYAAMCGVPPAAIEALDAQDLTALSRKTADFTRQLEAAAEGPTGENGENTSPK